MNGVVYSQAFEDEKQLYKLQKGELALSPWVVQNIVYELLVRHMTLNSPADMGYPFSQKYDPDRTKSEIFVDIAYNWKQDVVNKRPAVFVTRGSAAYHYQTMKGGMNSDSVFTESEYGHAAIVTMPIQVKCIATNVGFSEQLADYLKWPLMAYQQQIQEDFSLRQFRLKQVGAPEIFVEAKEHFVVKLDINAAFDEGWVVKGDDLKLKQVTKVIFDQLTGQSMNYE